MWSRHGFSWSLPLQVLERMPRLRISVSGGKTRSVSSASVPGRDAALEGAASRITKRSVSLESAAGAELEAAFMVWSPLHRIEHFYGASSSAKRHESEDVLADHGSDTWIRVRDMKFLG